MASFSRVRLALVLLAGYSAYTAVSLKRLKRPSLGGAVFFEDTADGTGTRYRALKRRAATQGAFTNIELTIRPGAPGFIEGLAGSPPFHSHPEDETIVVREGTMDYVIGEGKKPSKATAGQTVTVPGGEPHSYHNPSKKENLVIEVINAPAPPLGERYYESIAGLSRTYGGPREIHPLQITLLMKEAGVKVHGLPWLYDFVATHVLPYHARLLGFRSTYPEYTSGIATPKDTEDREPEWAADEL